LLVAWFGGAFDPPHLGHRAIVAALCRGFDEVWVAPAGVPVHRTLSGCGGAAERARWTKQALVNPFPRARLWDFELRRDEPTPTIESLRALAKLRAGAVLVVVLGADAFANLASWVAWPAHAALASFVVVPRSDRPMPEAPEPLVWRRWQDWRRAPVPGAAIAWPVRTPRVAAHELRAQLARKDARALGWIPAAIREEVWQAWQKKSGCRK